MNCEKQAFLNPNLSNMVLLSMSMSICLAQVTTSRSWKLRLKSPTNLFFLLLSLLFGNQLWYFLCLNLHLLKFLLISGFLAFFRHCLSASKRLSIKKISGHLTATRTLTNLQYGFPSKNSTSTARLKITEDIRMDKRHATIFTLFDCPKAFDCVFHPLITHPFYLTIQHSLFKIS